jgi:hypothetical protein
VDAASAGAISNDHSFPPLPSRIALHFPSSILLLLATDSWRKVKEEKEEKAINHDDTQRQQQQATRKIERGQVKRKQASSGQRETCEIGVDDRSIWSV